MIESDRRAVLRTSAVLVGAAAAGLATPGSQEAVAAVPRATPSGMAAAAATYEAKPLPLDPTRIKGMSEKILVSHYENNYLGAVKRLNQITVQLAENDVAKMPTFVLNGLKREQLLAYNSMVLHELFFAGLGEASRPSAVLMSAIEKDFGSFDRWKADFAATGKALGGGSGWVLLTYSQRDERLVNQWAADHTTTLADGRPILALDMYEHAYHMDYGAKAGGYVDAFMEAIRWPNADTLYERYRRDGA